MTLRLILVDDQEMYRLGFRMLLETQEGVEVVGEAEDGRAAVDLIERVEADIVLMDVRMPRMNGIDATRTVVQGAADGPRVIVLTTFDLDEYAYEAIRAGASGFLLKDASLEELMAAIHHVHAGDAVMAPSTTRRLIEHFTLPPPVIDDGDDRFRALEDLTAREREVLARVARGLSNEAIARDLRVAEGTVRVHVSRILGKLGLRDRAQAVVLAYESGLVSPRKDADRADRDLQRDGRVEP
ncbi:DNA-binding response regulator [Actinomyces naeslundii]|jgi:two component transcriptional regulator, luxR family|uniref:response regulator n=1 Tax=Actinomyces naeslundii TaxID=1655 RepID=UPI00096DB7F4|nr:response regulator transcription factor [Actinomyces naeslundii]OMG28372.1 DNA-binding response regulator [Actinomyces naeslundii]OMG41248.1 DNA-binding response regulator [Actinomyces naeslundii]